MTNIHRGFVVYDWCQCLSVGADGTREHRGSLTLIEISEGLSKGRRTKSCENHLQNYLGSVSGWVIVKHIEDIIAPEHKELSA